MISVLIPARNEEQDLPGCLESVSWSNDIQVLDSFSTDRTTEIARGFGAQVVQPPASWFESGSLFGGNEANVKNWALSNIPFKYPWVFHLDADERMTPKLVASVQKAVENPGANVAFRIQRRDFFQDTWLKHVAASRFYLRLFRPEKMRYERLINPVSIPAGPAGDVTGYLDHFPFSKGISHWLERHNSYTTFEAQQTLINRTSHSSFSLFQALLARDFHQRRYHQKEVFYRLPARPLVKFLLLYLVKRGFLDGRAGFTYATLMGFCEYITVLKTRELAESGKT